MNRRTVFSMIASTLLGYGFEQRSMAAPENPGQVAVFPIEIRIQSVGVIARVEVITVDNGVMGSPTNLSLAGWYQESSPLGMGYGNSLLTGFYWWSGMPALMTDLALVKEGDEIILVGDDENTFRYVVTQTETVIKETADLSAIVGATEAECITIISDTGMPDTSNTFPQSLYVRAERSQ